MSTIKKFYDDVYLKEYNAKITNVELYNSEKKQYLIELDETIFFPEGGGQPCDLGSISGFQVVDVKEKGDKIFHIIKINDSDMDASENKLSPGLEVELKIDWERRFDNMQRHCGEHILSGIFYREYGGVNRGFHMGEDYMTIDISLEERPEFTELTYEMAKHAELCANQVIWSNAPVIRQVYKTKADTECLPLRKKVAIEKDISIVCVGSFDNAADCVACCGTHPSTAGQVGLIKIFKVEVNKGMFRVYCEAGQRALKDYSFKHDIFTVLTNKYSAVPATLLAQMAREEEKNKSVRNELYILKQSIVSQRAASISNDIKYITTSSQHDNIKYTFDPNMLSCTEGVFVYSFDDLPPDDILSIGRKITDYPPKVLILVSEPNNTLFLISDGKTCDCGKIIKDNAHIYNGKGGGRPDNARALFPTKEYLDTFISLVISHLR